MLISVSLVMDGGVLGQNRDAALALELVAVHGAFGDALVGSERAALVQQRVDQRGLAMVDVRDDGDVAPERICDGRHPSQSIATTLPAKESPSPAHQTARRRALFRVAACLGAALQV